MKLISSFSLGAILIAPAVFGVPGETIEISEHVFIPESLNCALRISKSEEGFKADSAKGYGKECGDEDTNRTVTYRREVGTNSFVWEGRTFDTGEEQRCEITFAYPTKFYQTCYLKKNKSWVFQNCVPYIDENVGLQ